MGQRRETRCRPQRRAVTTLAQAKLGSASIDDSVDGRRLAIVSRKWKLILRSTRSLCQSSIERSLLERNGRDASGYS
jgi:hypothetical protein